MTTHTAQSTQPFIPLAERPFATPEETDIRHETVWENPTDQDIHLDLYVGTVPVYSPQAKAKWRDCTRQQLFERQKGIRRYVIPARSKRAIPAEFDRGIQAYKCMEDGCTGRVLYCTDHSHRKQTIGGLAPALINHGLQHRPTLHPSLDTALMKQEAAQQAQAEAIAAKNSAESRLIIANEMVAKAQEEARDGANRLARSEAEKAQLLARLGAQTAGIEETHAPPQASPQPSKNAGQQGPHKEGK